MCGKYLVFRAGLCRCLSELSENLRVHASAVVLEDAIVSLGLIYIQLVFTTEQQEQLQKDFRLITEDINAAMLKLKWRKEMNSVALNVGVFIL